MQTPTSDVQTRDVVVVGSGAAGLRAAAEIEGYRTTIVAPSPGGFESSSSRATGGIAAAVSDDDSPELHAEDTLRAGAGLCEPELVRELAEAAPEQVRKLEEYGLRLDRDGSGRLELGREAAHSRRRIVRTGRDCGGTEIVETLYDRAVEGRPNVEVVAGEVVDICTDGGRVEGVLYRGDRGGLRGISAPVVVLATGGLGGLYARTTNPNAVSGRGLALAYRAGATLRDLEFVQFHPTAVDMQGARLPLLSEFLRGEGAKLTDDHGERVLPDWEGEPGELAPRHVVAREICRLRERGEAVYLDVSPVESFRERFPGAASAASRVLDRDRPERIPVAPAAHYHMGGVATDLSGRTDVDGLWACGEVAGTGVHGANRLASNSMLECLITGERAAEDIVASGRAARSPNLRSVRRTAARRPTDVDHLQVARTIPAPLRAKMWENVGLLRGRRRLARATRLFGSVRRELVPGTRARDAALVAELVARSARRREETRGAHQRRDFPDDSEGWRGHIEVTPGARGTEIRAERPPAAASWTFSAVEARG